MAATRIDPRVERASGGPVRVAAAADARSDGAAEPVLSIIVPTLNEAKVIAATLRHLASGLTLAHEVIVSDGGSADDTVELARPYATKVVSFSGPGRQTIAQGRNAGAALARGDFLVFLDADCVVPEPDRFFGRALARFEANARLLGLTARLRVLPERETLGDRLVLAVINLLLRLSNNVLRHGHSFGEFQMIRREAFARLGGFRDDLVTLEDANMFYRLSRIGETMIDPSLEVFHTNRRVHEIGWVRSIGIAVMNGVFFAFRDRPYTKEWKPIR